jgi:putative oxidoreductase
LGDSCHYNDTTNQNEFLFTIKKTTMKKIIRFVVYLLFGLMFINSGLNKFFNYMPVPKDLPDGLIKVMTAFMEVKWLMPLIAIAEIVGGLLVITNKYRALGAIIIFPVMIGIVLTHIIYAPSGLPVALVLLAIDLWIIIENREKYLPMVTTART